MLREVAADTEDIYICYNKVLASGPLEALQEAMRLAVSSMKNNQVEDKDTREVSSTRTTTYLVLATSVLLIKALLLVDAMRMALVMAENKHVVATTKIMSTKKNIAQVALSRSS